MAERRATVTWEGTLTKGSGTIRTGSGALSDAPVTWASRIERADGKTSPEELLAAAQAECYAMVISNMLTQKGNVPDRLQVTAICTVDKHGEGLKITTMQLQLEGDVPGIDAETFTQIARDGEQNCPVSNAIRGNVEITVEAQLHQSSVSAR